MTAHTKIQDINRRIIVPVVQRAAVFADPSPVRKRERIVYFTTYRTGLAAGRKPVDDAQFRPIPRAFVREHAAKFTPTGI